MLHKTDKQRVKMLLKGGERDFEDFFNEFFPKIYRFCARRMSGSELEDVVMIVMRQSFRSMHSYRGEASLYTWMCQIARGELSTYYKKSGRKPYMASIEDRDDIRALLESIPSDQASEPDNILAGDQRNEFIQLLLDYLPGNYGLILEAKYVEGLSMQEIAERFETTPKAVESLLSRARTAFRTHFSEINRELTTNVKPFPGKVT